MTSQIVAELPFYSADGSFLGYANYAAALILELTQPQESGPLVPQNLDGRLFEQRIIDGEGAVLKTVTGVNRTLGRVAFTLTSDDTRDLLPDAAVAAADLVHVVGEVTSEGLTPLISSTFGLRRVRPGVGAVVLKLEPTEGVVMVRYAGAPPLTMLQELIAAGDLPADATHEDMIVFWQGQVATYGQATLDSLAAQLATSIETVQAQGAAQSAIVTDAGAAASGVVNAAGATQTGAVNAAGGVQVAAVEGAGATQVAGVNAAGTAQTGLVNTAGGVQVAAVNAAGTAAAQTVADREGVALAAIAGAESASTAPVIAEGATQTAAVTAAGAAQLDLVNTAGAAWALALGIPEGGIFDVIAADLGYLGGLAITDQYGFTVEDRYFRSSSLPGPVVRVKIPGVDWSAEAAPIRIFAMPPLPDGFLFLHDMRLGDGLYVPNIVSGTPSTFSGNVFGFPNGDIRNASASTTSPPITKFHDGLAARLLYGTTAQIFYFVNTATTAPGTIPAAGHIYVDFEVRTLTGSPQNARLGSPTGPTDEDPIVIPTTYQTFAFDAVIDGTNYTSIGLRGDGTNILDIDIKNIRVSMTPLVGAFDYTRAWEVRRRAAFDGGLLYDADGALDGVTGNGTGRGGAYSLIAGPDMTTADSPTDGQLVEEFTYWVLFDQQTGGNLQMIASTETDLALPLPAKTIELGIAADGTLSTEPVKLTGVTDFVVAGQGYMVLIERVKAGKRAININDVCMRWLNTAAYTPWKFRHMLLGGSSTAAQLKGGIAGDGFALHYFSDAECDQLMDYIRERYRGTNLFPAVRSHIGLAIADSRTAAAAGPAGPSCFSQQGIGNRFKGGTFQLLMRNMARSGYGADAIYSGLTVNDPTASLPAGDGGYLRRIEEIHRGGSIAVVMVGPIGVNDSGGVNGVIADPLAYFTNKVLPIWRAIKATGPMTRLVVCPELISGIPGWNAAIAIYNAAALAASAEYDAIADWTADAIMTDPAQLTNATYWSQGDNPVLHPAPAGHTILDGYLFAAVDSVIGA